MQKEKKEITIPFCGFYETYAREQIDRAIYADWAYKNGIEAEEECDLDDETQKKYEDFYLSEEHDLEVAKYKKDYITQYARAYFSQLHNETDINLFFEDDEIVLDSPQYYNFTTDRIFVKVEKEKLLELYKKLDKVKFAEKIKEKFTSYDGFSSYYDNSIDGDDWVDVEKYDHNNWLTVLECFLDDEVVDNLHTEVYL